MELGREREASENKRRQTTTAKGWGLREGNGSTLLCDGGCDGGATGCVRGGWSLANWQREPEQLGSARCLVSAQDGGERGGQKREACGSVSLLLLPTAPLPSLLSSAVSFSPFLLSGRGPKHEAHCGLFYILYLYVALSLSQSRARVERLATL